MVRLALWYDGFGSGGVVIGWRRTEHLGRLNSQMCYYRIKRSSGSVRFVVVPVVVKEGLVRQGLMSWFASYY